MIFQIPFRYGHAKFGTYDSWLHCRVAAFTSSACLDAANLFLKVGDPASGFIECANSKTHFGAQLTGWSKSLASEWKLLQPASFPGLIELDSNVLSALPRG